MTFFRKLYHQTRQILNIDPTNNDSDLLKSTTSHLAQDIQKQFPQLMDRQCSHWAGITGLLCRVAFVDLKITAQEKQQLVKCLDHLLGSENAFATRALAEMGISHMQAWAGIEYHLYCDYLKNSLSIEEKRKLIDALFILAGSDGNADNQESEEIKTISRGLLLEDKEYYLSRARNKELIGALRSE